MLKTLLLLRFSNPKYPASNLGIDYSWSCWLLVFSWLIGFYLLVDWLLPCWLIGCYLVGGCGSIWNSWCHLFGAPCTSCVTLDVNVKRKLWSCFTAAPPFGLIELLLIRLLSFMLPLVTWLFIIVACLLLLTIEPSNSSKILRNYWINIFSFMFFGGGDNLLVTVVVVFKAHLLYAKGWISPPEIVWGAPSWTLFPLSTLLPHKKSATKWGCQHLCTHWWYQKCLNVPKECHQIPPKSTKSIA